MVAMVHVCSWRVVLRGYKKCMSCGKLEKIQ